MGKGQHDRSNNAEERWMLKKDIFDKAGVSLPEQKASEIGKHEQMIQENYRMCLDNVYLFCLPQGLFPGDKEM